jgi:hypothetical protein
VPPFQGLAEFAKIPRPAAWAVDLWAVGPGKTRGHVTLHLWEVALHLREVTLHLREVALHLREVALHLREVTLHLREVALHLREVALHLREVTLHLREVTLHLRENGVTKFGIRVAGGLYEEKHPFETR